MILVDGENNLECEVDSRKLNFKIIFTFKNLYLIYIIK